MRLGPQLLHDLHLLLGAAPAVVKILVKPQKLHFVPADPDPKPEPAPAQHVETSGLLGDKYSLALRQDQHAGRKPEFARAACEISEQHKRVVVQPGPGTAGLRCACLAGAEDMVGRLDKVVADLFR